MVKLVLDTSTLISAFFWKGNEYELIKKIEENKVKLFTSKQIIKELEDIFNRSKFNHVIKKTNQSLDMWVD